MKPIIFNTEMVRAILDGRKTTMRLVIKPQPTMYGFTETHFDWHNIKQLYHPGDILYVQETWCNYGELDDNDQVIDGTEQYYYRADGENPTPFNYIIENDKRRDYPIWHPSIHMPKEAARLFLRVKDVRIERLQDATETDAIKEGFEPVICDHPNGLPCTDCLNTGYLEPAMLVFIEEWDMSIPDNEKEIYGYNANPWIWVIKFEIVDKEDAK